MKHLQFKPKYYSKDSDRRFQQTFLFWGRLSSIVTPTSYAFEATLSNHKHPCRNDHNRSSFRANDYLINGIDWFEWLKGSNLKGKVKVRMAFDAWYSSFLHDRPEDDVMENSRIYFWFSHKQDAMLFKLSLAGPELVYLS